MADKLSLPNLLSLLDIKPQDDDAILKLCYKAEELRRRRLHTEAISTAADAVKRARSNPNTNYHLHGITLMYSCATRLSSGWRNQRRLAILDCNGAIISFSQEPYNRAIAEIMRALAELDKEDKGSVRRRRILIHFQRAIQILQKLDLDYRVPSGLKKVAAELLTAVNERVLVLTVSISDTATQLKLPGREADDSEVAAEVNLITPTPPSTKGPPIDLPVPTQLVWPIPDAHDLVLEPKQGKSTTEETESRPGPNASDHIEISQFWINDKLYEVHPIGSTANIRGTLEYFKNQTYVPIPISNKKTSSDQYVLVRRQDWPDQASQKVVVADRRHKRVWVWMATDDLGSIPPRIIGGIGDTWTGIQDLWHRDAQARFTAAQRITDDVQMIGVVEAILTPVTSSESLSSSTPTSSSSVSTRNNDVSEHIGESTQVNVNET